MLYHYLKIALRQIHRQKVFSGVNIFGFAAGLAVCLLILLYILDEVRYDRFHKNFRTIYRVVQEQNQSGTWYQVARSPAPLAAALQQDIPEITNATRFALPGNILLQSEDKQLDEPGGIYAEKNLFELFDFSFVKGSAAIAFTNPRSIVLTENLAHKYFGKSNPIGRSIKINGQHTLIVTGIIQNLPAHSHLQFDFVIPFNFLKEYGVNVTEWGANAYYTYVQVAEATDFTNINAKIRNYYKEKLDRKDEVLYLQALKDIHLYSDFDFNSDFGARGDIRYVRFFALIAGIILLLACFNFMNLSTARASTRAKEVGLRQVIGANKNQLLFQFLGESLLFSGVAGILAFIGVQFALPFFNALTGKQISINHFDLTYFLPFATLIFFAGLLAGLYPAFFLSSFRPVQVLKGQTIAASGGAALRKGLVTGQFALSLIMIIGTILINKQLHFISNKKLGLNKDNLVYLEMRGQLKDKYAVVKKELQSLPAIVAISGTNYSSLPFKSVGSSGSGGFQFPGKNPKDHFMIHNFTVAPDFIQTLQLEVKEGRNFSTSITTDTTNFLLNEAAVARMALRNPVGQRLSFYGKQGTVIGVVKDFHFAALQKKIEPALIQVKPQNIDYLLIRFNPANTRATLASIQKIVKQNSPDYPVELHFMDSAYEYLYQEEQKISVLFNGFAGLAILISCLGLFGLVSFISGGRTKEIGVRKVLGASTGTIVLLLSRDFIKMLLLATLLAWPVAYFGIKQWLQNYAFQTEVNFWLFAGPSIAVILLALLTISGQTWKAASTNPAQVLRRE